MKIFPVAFSKNNAPSVTRNETYENDPLVTITAGKNASVVAVEDGQLVRSKNAVHIYGVDNATYVYVGIKPKGKDRAVKAGEIIGSVDKTEKFRFEIRRLGLKPDTYGMLGAAPTFTVPGVPWGQYAKYAGLAAASLGVGYAVVKVVVEATRKPPQKELKPVSAPLSKDKPHAEPSKNRIPRSRRRDRVRAPDGRP